MQNGHASRRVPSDGPVILVVEDNAAMRALIKSLVTEVASTVRECGSAEDALRLYGSVRPDCVLMDIALPGLDGLAATRAIRQLDAAARVIIVTEHDDAQYREAARAAGASDFVLKDDLLTLPSRLRSSTA
jgi:CheY-like chemotaxis protein